MSFKKLALAIATTVGLGVGTAHANLVTNGGFETGDTTGWLVMAPPGGWFVGATGPYNGAYYASTGCVNEYCNMSQMLNTVAGQTYDLSFAFNPGAGVTISGADTKVYWNNLVVADVGLGSPGWTVYTVRGLLASSSWTRLLFSGYQNPAWNGVDDISVNVAAVAPPVTVPEPDTLALLGLAGLGLAISRRRKVT